MDLKYINPYYTNNYLTRDINKFDGFITPIYDRTEEDVITLRRLLDKGYKNFTDEEKELWNQSLKGAFNISDINRIENNIYILGLCLELNIDKKIYFETDIPLEADFQRIKDNLTNIKNNCPYSILIDHIPELPYNTYEKINTIEKITYDIYNILSQQLRYYCGNNSSNSTVQLYCGSAEF